MINDLAGGESWKQLECSGRWAQCSCHWGCLQCPYWASAGKSEVFVPCNASSTQACRNTWKAPGNTVADVIHRRWLCGSTQPCSIWAVTVQLGDWSHQNLSICLSGSLTSKLGCAKCCLKMIMRLAFNFTPSHEMEQEAEPWLPRGYCPGVTPKLGSRPIIWLFPSCFCVSDITFSMLKSQQPYS